MKTVAMLMIMMSRRLSNDGSVIWIREVSRPPVKQQRPLIMLILPGSMVHTDIQWDLHISRTFTYINTYLYRTTGLHVQVIVQV